VAAVSLATPQARPWPVAPLPRLGGDLRAVDAAAARELPDAVEHTIELDLDGTPPPEAGVATFATATGAGLRWHPLRELGLAAHGGSIRLALPAAPTTLTLAASPADARHGYLARCDLPAAAHRPAQSHLATGFSPTRLSLPAGVADAGPLQLVRRDDPAWQRPHAIAAGLFVAPDCELLLGPGDYELVDAIDPDRRQRFTVPSAPIAIGARLARPRADRR
jgi:hypothetical protein